MSNTVGIGSFGKVKKCMNTETGQIYAVKIIPRNQYKGASGVVSEKKKDQAPK